MGEEKKRSKNGLPILTGRDTISFNLLVNGGSASGAEIVAGAIQTMAVASCRNSDFGKGSVQTIIPLKDGSGLRLTTARYYTPSGRSIQAKGIVPDIIVKPSRPEEEKESVAPKFPAEKDLERHLMDAEQEKPKEKKSPRRKKSQKKKKSKRKNQSIISWNERLSSSRVGTFSGI